jgi:hypothetical protein
VFWNDPIVQAALENTLGTRRRDLLLRDRTVSSTMTLLDSGWAETMRCVPHDCGDNNAQLFFDLSANKIEACWSEASAGSVTRTYWLSPHQAPRLIPSNGCEGTQEFLARFVSER